MSPRPIFFPGGVWIMLQEQLAVLARNAIENGLAERRKIFACEVERIRKDMASMGMLSSGPLIERIRRLCENELDIRAQLIVGRLLRVAPADGGLPALAGDLKEELRKYLPAEPEDLIEAYEAAARGVPGSDRRAFSFALARARDEALRKAEAQLDAFVAGLGKAPAREPNAAFPAQQPVIRPQAPAVDVQRKTPPIKAEVTPPSTGPSPAQAPPAPNIPAIREGAGRPLSPAEKERLGRALQGVRNEIERWPGIGGYARHEVVALLEEARAELIKEYANRFRLAAVAAGLAEIAGFVPDAVAAYNELRAAMIVAGLTAPPPGGGTA